MATVQSAPSAMIPGNSPTAANVAIPRDSPQSVNILLTSFAGLGLPRTLSLPVSGSAPISDVVHTILDRLPRIDHRLIITTTSNKQLLLADDAPVSTLLTTPKDTFLPLRLSARLCGGKGGFGSQLRAAGGRMSSRKNRQNQENVNGSNRNLDGRRLRTVDEAKKLAEYLAIKPEMAKREKEERKKRWEAVVAAAEKREEEVRSGKTGVNQGRLDAEYVESKELAEEKTREAVLKAMREGMTGVDRTGSESSAEAEDDESEEGDELGSSASSEDAVASAGNAGGKAFFGWDEEEDEDDDEGEGEGEGEEPATAPPAYEGKGKARAALA
ncbi:hypothetical protein LTR36_010821 [Oleoguttula mirabilis]|uniref:Sde2 N-terminal ubiquitin domain-containing protein n=1 Tax=Oleoguttula mirabilis TaxID=1507867 RepID=A0AAV9JS94_9PEZI|nr:hypothetical protein LTR36_010821 [Oleoguttula mirabilis]